VENCIAGTAAFALSPISPTTLMTPPFAMSGGTGVPNGGNAWLQMGVRDVVVIDQRPRTAKLGRPPRGNHC
jgi:hypothetical protein